MNYKKILIWTISIILTIAVIFIIFRIVDNRNGELALNEIEENSTQISSTIVGEDEPVVDECIDEWEDYNRYIGEKIEEASNNLAENDTHYLLKDILGYIEVYYIGENNEPFLYKKTDIATAYLSQEDIADLKVGIEVVGIEALNKMLEDFE